MMHDVGFKRFITPKLQTDLMTEPNNPYVLEQKITKTKPLSVTHKRTHVKKCMA